MPKGDIRLSREHGVNPSVLLCEWCGKEYGVGLLGKTNRWRCRCGQEGYGKTIVCPRCNGSKAAMNVEEDVEAPRRMTKGLCGECEKKQETADEAVREGGVYWRCKDCGSSGAIKASSPLAGEVRRKMQIVAPKPCGVEFNKEKGCPVCSGGSSEQQHG